VTGAGLVLGGTGFIGREVCAALAAAGYPVVAVSRHAAPVEAARCVALDLSTSTPDDLEALLRKECPAVVVNAAGAVWGVGPAQLVASNVALVRHLVTSLSRLPVRPRLVHLGSAHEYGPVPAGTPIRESTPTRPTSPYGRTKLRGSRQILAASRSGRIDAVVLRVVNVTGPGTPDASLLGQVAAQLAAAARERRTAVLRLAPLRARRDFVDVRDLADAVLAAARAPASGEAVNIGRGRAVSVRWLVRSLIAASGTPAEVIEEEDPHAAPGRSAGIEWQQVDPSLARVRLGWWPRRTLADSLRALWERAGAPDHRSLVGLPDVLERGRSS
jgi:nucleoside-diphosphate-sugar epimerase